MDLSKINLAGRISHFFTINRPLSILLLIVFLVFGLVSFFITPKQYNPQIERPAFAISIKYDGASSEAAIDRVVYELVEKIDTVPGVDEINTEVSDGAEIYTTVVFEVGYDTAKAKLDLLSQLEQYSYLARGNISIPQVMEIDPETIPVLQIVFGSDKLSINDLRSKVVEISHALGRVRGVSMLETHGGYQSAVLVEVDPVKLSTSQLSLEEVLIVLKDSQSRSLSSDFRTNLDNIDIMFDGAETTAAEVGDITLAPGVKLRDVASVYEGPVSDRSYIFYQTESLRGEVVMLSVSKVKGESAPVVAKDLLLALDNELEKPALSELTYRVVSNDGVTAQTEIIGLTQNLVTSIAIVAIVLLLFLSTRAALVVLVAIPVTLLVVFGLGLLFDQTINRITLFALILSLGLLVDSAIVATENIYSKLKVWQQNPSGKTKESVIASAVDEIGAGLLLSTITSVIVFLPMNFITGMMGPYMGPIAFFVPAALIVSFLVAIVVTPFVASYLLHEPVVVQKKPGLFVRMMHVVTKKYTDLLRSILYSAKLQKIILRGVLFLFAISLVLPAIGLVHFQMLPRADRDQFYVYIDLPVGTGREETARIASLISGVLIKDPDIVHIQEFVATPPILDFNGMFKGARSRDKSHQASLRLNLTPSNERERSSTNIASAGRQLLAMEQSAIAPMVRFMEDPPGPPVQATLVAKISSGKLEEQRDAATHFASLLSKVDGVVDVYQSDEAVTGRVRYNLNRPNADALGVSPDAAALAVKAIGGGLEVVELLDSTGSEYKPIVLKLLSEYRSSPEVIDSIAVKSATGEMVPLRSVIDIEHELRPSITFYEDVTPLSYVTAEVEDRSIVYVMIELIKQLMAGNLSGYEVTDWNLFSMTLVTDEGFDVEIGWGGEWEMTLENFRDLGMAMGVALLLVYALLVSQYNRFSTPAYILVTVPLGLVGILWGFLILDMGFGIYLTATALIGFIALIGIVVNNAIIYLEYVEQAKTAGASYREALIQAGEARLRPIFLTSLTTVLGSLTIASDPVWSGLAWAIIFGLSLSTFLTLIIYPTLLVRFASDHE